MRTFYVLCVPTVGGGASSRLARLHRPARRDASAPRGARTSPRADDSIRCRAGTLINCGGQICPILTVVVMFSDVVFRDHRCREVNLCCPDEGDAPPERLKAASLDLSGAGRCVQAFNGAGDLLRANTDLGQFFAETVASKVDNAQRIAESELAEATHKVRSHAPLLRNQTSLTDLKECGLRRLPPSSITPIRW